MILYLTCMLLGCTQYHMTLAFAYIKKGMIYICIYLVKSSINTHLFHLELFASWVIFYVFMSSAEFFKINFFEKFFQEYHQRIKQF